MSYYPHLVQTAWHTVEQLVKDWVNNPHHWDREIDIQSELRARLATIFSLTGLGQVVFHEEGHPPSIESKTYRYSRVSCEPSIPYTYSDQKEHLAVPDVVIWDTLADPTIVPKDGWPVLWACEIKYKSSDHSDWDEKKLGYLLDEKRIEFGCWLKFHIDNSLREPLISWDKRQYGTRLWVCTVSAPL